MSLERQLNNYEMEETEEVIVSSNIKRYGEKFNRAVTKEEEKPTKTTLSSQTLPESKLQSPPKS
jgi:hypothetical protein